MIKNTVPVLLLFLLSAAAFAQNKSVYTPLTDNRCAVRIDSTVPGVMNGVCRGVGDYQLEILLDDERMSVNVIAPANEKFALDFWGHFRNFSSVGEKAEWRLRGRTPVGLIVRYDVSDRGDGNKPTSYLMVSKLGPKGSCLVGIVKPGKNQNIEARKLADAASNKPCKTAE
jgi:hypothetical protein